MTASTPPEVTANPTKAIVARINASTNDTSDNIAPTYPPNAQTKRGTTKGEPFSLPWVGGLDGPKCQIAEAIDPGRQHHQHRKRWVRFRTKPEESS